MYKAKINVLVLGIVLCLAAQVVGQPVRANAQKLLEKARTKVNPNNSKPTVSTDEVAIESNGTFWKIHLTHKAVNKLESKESAAIIALVATELPEVGANLALATTVLVILDKIGGNKGVDIVGSVLHPWSLPTSAPWNTYGVLKSLTKNISVTGHIGDVLRAGMKYAGDNPGMAAALGPIGINIWASKKIVNKVLGHKDGGLEAKAGSVGKREKLFLIRLEKENKIALLSAYNGRYVYAPDGGGNSLWARFPHIKKHEKWDLVPNSNGTVSLRSSNGHYIRANNGGGGPLNADAKQIGSHEQFWLKSNADGTVSLQTYEKGLYVTVKS